MALPLAKPPPPPPKPEPQPTITAWSIVHRGPALWALREYVIKGGEVTFTESEPDSKAPTIGRIVRRIERVNP